MRASRIVSKLRHQNSLKRIHLTQMDVEQCCVSIERSTAVTRQQGMLCSRPGNLSNCNFYKSFYTYMNNVNSPRNSLLLHNVSVISPINETQLFSTFSQIYWGYFDIFWNLLPPWSCHFVMCSRRKTWIRNPVVLRINNNVNRMGCSTWKGWRRRPSTRLDLYETHHICDGRVRGGSPWTDFRIFIRFS